MTTSKKISITVVVNGQPTVVDAIGDAPLGTIIPDALRQTENSGQPSENWELRDAEGNLLDLDKKIEDYGFPEKVQALSESESRGRWQWLTRPNSTWILRSPAQSSSARSPITFLSRLTTGLGAGSWSKRTGRQQLLFLRRARPVLRL